MRQQSGLGVSTSDTVGEKVTRLASCSFMVAIFSVKKFAKLLGRSLADLHDGYSLSGILTEECFQPSPPIIILTKYKKNSGEITEKSC